MDVVAGYGPLAQRREAAQAPPLRTDRPVACAALLLSRSPDLLLVSRARSPSATSSVWPPHSRSRQAGHPDPQVRAGSDPPHRRQAHSRTGCIPGGMNKALTAAERDLLAHRRRPDRRWSREAIGLRGACMRPAGILRPLRRIPAPHDGLVDANGGSTSIMAACAPRTRTEDDFRPRDTSTYRNLLGEQTKPWSYMKFPYIRSLGGNGWYRVAHGTCEIADFLPSPRPKRSARRSAPPAAVNLSTGRCSPTGAADRDVVRGRALARSSRRSRHRRNGPDG